MKLHLQHHCPNVKTDCPFKHGGCEFEVRKVTNLKYEPCTAYITQQVLILYKRTIPESLTPMSDQDRISPYIYQYNINQINDENKEK